MQVEKDQISLFLELVLRKMRNRNSYFIFEDTDKAESEVAKYILQFRKKINLISIALKDIHFAELNHFSSLFVLNRRNIFSLITFHCDKIRQVNESIFFAFMYACSYVTFALNFFEAKGLDQLSKLNCMCTREIFEHLIKESFEEKGGWLEMKNFTLANNLPQFIDFFCSCYTDNMKLCTNLKASKTRQKAYNYRFHDENLASLRKTFDVLETIIKSSYRKEFEKNPQYLAEVLSSFQSVRTKIEQSTAKKTETGEDPTSNQEDPFVVNISHIHVDLKHPDSSDS